jgi:very-short-patch-repair endonuclease
VSAISLDSVVLAQVVLGRARDRMVRVDARFPGTPVVVELLGYRFHRTTTQMRRDADRLNALVLDGLRPYQFTYDHVVLEPDRMIDDLRQALCVSDQPPDSVVLADTNREPGAWGE